MVDHLYRAIDVLEAFSGDASICSALRRCVLFATSMGRRRSYSWQWQLQTSCALVSEPWIWSRQHSLRNCVLFKDKAGASARDIHAMAGKRAPERKTNIRELGYRRVELARHLGPALAEH
jgi:hypothetical protein